MNDQPPITAPRKWLWFIAAGAAAVGSCLLILSIILLRYDVNNLKPFIIQVIKERTGRDLVIRGRIGLDIGLVPSILVENVALQNAPWGKDSTMATVQRMELQIPLIALLRREIEVKKLTLIEPRFLVETDRSGRSNLEFRTARLPSDKGVTAPNFSLTQVKVKKGVFSFRDGKTGKSFSVTVDYLQAKQSRDEGLMELKMRCAYGSRRFEVKGKVGTMACLLDPERPWMIHVVGKGLGAEGRLDGFIRNMAALRGVVMKVNGAGRSPSEIMSLFGVEHLPEVGPFKIGGKLADIGEKKFQVSSLQFDCKAGSGEGKLELDLRSRTPRVKGWLSFKKIDLSSFLANEGKQKMVPIGGAAKKVFSSDPLPTAFLAKLDGDMEVKADRVCLSHMALEEVSARITLAKGVLSVKSLRAKAGTGEMEASLEVKSGERDPLVALNAKMSHVNLNLLLGEKKAEGEVEMELDLSGRGASLAALMGGLNGHTFFALRDFRMDNKYLKHLGGDFISSILQILSPTSNENDCTEVNCLVSGFEIKKGLAEVTALVADTRETVLTGSGHVDLNTETLDLPIRPYPKKGIAGVSMSLCELAKAFKVAGSLSEPSIQIDAGESVWTVGKAVGSILLLGPAGVALIFTGQTASEGDLCAAAVEAARRGMKVPEPPGAEERQEHAHKGMGTVKNTLRDLGEKVRNLFSGPPAPPRKPPDGY
jgi:uncharacterized protein involved in outer membrane biogenesis